MIIKIDTELLVIDANNYNSSSQLYLSLWKKLYNIEIKKESLDIEDISSYIKNKKIFI